MAFQVSPGINVSEVDKTAGAQQVSVSDAAFAGPFVWGPALQVMDIGSEDELVRTFGKPDGSNYEHWFSAQSFLAYSQLLHVVRAVSGDALNSTANAATLGTVEHDGNAATTWTANGFSTSLLHAGQTVELDGLDYVVASITSNTVFETVVGSANSVVHGTAKKFGVFVANPVAYENSFLGTVTGYGAWIAKYAGDLGNSLKVSVCSSSNAFSSAGTGNVVFTAGNTVVTGTGTTFTNLANGDFITANSVKVQVKSVTNATSLILVSAPTRSVATTNAWSRSWQYASLFDRAPQTSAYASDRNGANDELHLVVVDEDGAFTGTPGTVLERFAYLSKAADAKNVNGDANYYVSVINKQSQYVQWGNDEPASNQSGWGSSAAGVTFGVDALANTVSLTGGQASNQTITDGDKETAFDIFKNVDTIDISLVITGPASAALASYVIQNIAELRQDCVAFVSPTKDCVVNNPGQEVTSILAFRNQIPSSSYGFLDSGWKYTFDKYNETNRWVPLNGDIAGVAARSDASSDPWFSPAGFTRGNVKNVIKLAWSPTQLQRDDLYKVGVNSVVAFPGSGTVLYGDKTLLARPSAFDRINVRRLFIVLESTIKRLARAQLFEFNDEFTRAQFRNIVEPFLRDVKSRRGVTDYRVICDDTNNTPTVIQENSFVGDIYVKPAYSINFIQLNFVAVASGVSFQEVTGSAQ